MYIFLSFHYDNSFDSEYLESAFPYDSADLFLPGFEWMTTVMLYEHMINILISM